MRKLTKQNTVCHTWFERDRAHIGISYKKSGDDIADFWDDQIKELVEDGFLDPKDYHGSAIEYLNTLWGLDGKPMTKETHEYLCKGKHESRK